LKSTTRVLGHVTNELADPGIVKRNSQTVFELSDQFTLKGLMAARACRLSKRFSFVFSQNKLKWFDRTGHWVFLTEI